MLRADDVRSSLESIYRRWRQNLEPSGLSLRDWSTPLLLHATDEYCAADLRVIVYGQETQGWGWTTWLERNHPARVEPWSYQDQEKLADFVAKDDAIDALLWRYRQWAFARGPQPANSPFWQAFHQMRAWAPGILWDNLVRCDYNHSTPLDASTAERTRMLEIQRSLVLDELTALQPHVCIFLTGPDYDFVLDRTFGPVRYEPAAGAPVREFALLSAPSLPALSFRTYHPNFLRKSKRWGYLDSLRSAVADRGGALEGQCSPLSPL
jgi:hypothetical protein